MRCGYVSFIKVSCYGLRCEGGGDLLKKGGKYEKADVFIGDGICTAGGGLQ